MASVGTGFPATYLDGATPIHCKAKSFWDNDLHVSCDFDWIGVPLIGPAGFQTYLDVQNLFHRLASYDPQASCGTKIFDNTFDVAGVIGRVFKVGVRANV